MSPSALATPGIPSPGHHWETLLLIHLATSYLAKHTLGLGFVGVVGPASNAPRNVLLSRIPVAFRSSGRLAS